MLSDSTQSGGSTRRGAARGHWPDDLQSAITRARAASGVSLSDLSVGAVLEVTTERRTYTLKNKGEGRVLISGHPKYCAAPVMVKLDGSSWGGSMLKMNFIGRGMFMEFHHPAHGIVRTSRVLDIRRCAPESLTCQ